MTSPQQYAQGDRTEFVEETVSMDSLLYIGAGNTEEDDSEDEEEHQRACESAVTAASSSTSALDFAALQRAGYSSASADLSQTATFKRLEAEAKQTLEYDAAAKKRAEDEAAAAEQERRAAEKALLDTKVYTQHHSMLSET